MRQIKIDSLLFDSLHVEKVKWKIYTVAKNYTFSKWNELHSFTLDFPLLECLSGICRFSLDLAWILPSWYDLKFLSQQESWRLKVFKSLNGTAFHEPYGITKYITCHPTKVNALHLNLSQTNRYLIYLTWRNVNLSWPWCWLYTEMVYLSTDSHPSKYRSNLLTASWPEVKPVTSRLQIQQPTVILANHREHKLAYYNNNQQGCGLGRDISISRRSQDVLTSRTKSSTSRSWTDASRGLVSVSEQYVSVSAQ